MSPLWTTFDCRRRVLAFGLVRARTGALPAGIGRAGPDRRARRDGGGELERGQDSPDRLCLHRVRGRQPALGRPLPGLWRLEQPGRGGPGAVVPGQGVRPGDGPGPDHRGCRPDRRPPPPPGSTELDRVLGGGLVPGSVVLLAGEPGVGKSTLLLEVAGRAWPSSGPVLYVSAEESRAQVRLRAERIGALHARLLLAAETDLGAVLAPWSSRSSRPRGRRLGPDRRRPRGGRRPWRGRRRSARSPPSWSAWPRSARSPPCWSATSPRTAPSPGPRVLEHLVDVVCTSRATGTTPLRLVRAVKNRFGPTDEVGCFEMTEVGIERARRPARLFLSGPLGRCRGLRARSRLEGRRPLVTEVQALVAPTARSPCRVGPRRAWTPADWPCCVAVLDRGALGRLGRRRATSRPSAACGSPSPAADLAVCLALASAAPRPAAARRPGRDRRGRPGRRGPPGPALPRRLAEAARLGFRRGPGPPGAGHPNGDARGRPPACRLRSGAALARPGPLDGNP